MKKLLSLVLVMSFLPCLAKKQESEKRGVKFQNDAGSSVVVTVRDIKTGEKLASPTIRAGSSSSFPTKSGVKYALEAQEAGRKKEPLKTALYTLYLRTQDEQGTVRVVEADEKLAFVGNEEAEEGGAFVREMWMTPQWKRDMEKELRGEKVEHKKEEHKGSKKKSNGNGK